jgi:hypothetical protein
MQMIANFPRLSLESYGCFAKTEGTAPDGFLALLITLIR